MFTADLKESKQERVAINGVEPQMVGMLVSYAYTSEVYISKANVQVGCDNFCFMSTKHIPKVCPPLCKMSCQTSAHFTSVQLSKHIVRVPTGP